LGFIFLICTVFYLSISWIEDNAIFGFTTWRQLLISNLFYKWSLEFS